MRLCPQGLTPTVCSYGNCVVGDPGVNEATVEECVAPAQDFTGCPGDRTAACGPLESALVGEVPRSPVAVVGITLTDL